MCDLNVKFHFSVHNMRMDQARFKEKNKKDFRKMDCTT